MRAAFFLLVAAEVLASFADAATIPESPRDATRKLDTTLHRDIPSLAPVPPKSWTSSVRDGVLERLWGKARVEREQLKQKHLGTASGLLSRYAGDILLRFNLTSEAEGKAMVEASRILFLDVWSATKHHVDIRLAEDVVPALLGLLPTSLQHAHTRLTHDLGRAAKDTFPGVSSKPFSPSDYDDTTPISADNLFFHDYQPLSVIQPWMDLLQSLFPSHVQTISLGTSYEGREIKGLRVGNHLTSRNGERKRAVIVGGAAHAREWISVSTVCYLMYSFITAHTKERDTTNLVNEFDWIFIPTLNVDGYQYTWESDRLWRKNRQPTNLSFCKGIDLDRSYGFHWDASQFPSNPCSDSFPGETPFEAVESKRFADWVSNMTTNGDLDFVGFLDFHSYSQQILYPYSYSCATSPPDLENLEELAIGLAKAIRVRSGEHYEVGSACDGSGFFTQTETGGGGSALDYFYNHHVPFAYQIKLRDTGSYGFLLPKENIIPTGEEALSVLKYFGDFMIGQNAQTKKAPVEDKENTTGTEDVKVELRRKR